MLTKLKLFTASDFFKGSLIFTTISFLSNVINYFFNFIIGRTLGPVGFGEVTAFFSYIYIFSVPMSVVATVIIQKIGSAEGSKIEKANVFEKLFLEKIFKYWYVVFLCFIFPFIFAPLTNLSLATSFFFLPYLFLSLLGAFYSSALQGMKLFLLFGLASIVAVLVKFSGALLTLGPLNNTLTVFIFIFLSILIGLVINYVILHSQYKKVENMGTTRLEKKLMSIILNKQMLLTLVSLLGITLLNNADIVIVKKFLSSELTGLYGVWSLFAKIIFYGLSPLVTVAFIMFTESTNHKRQQMIFFGWITFSIFMLVTGYAIYSIFGKLLIQVLFGVKYLKIAYLLGSSAVFGVLYTLIVFLNNYFLAKKDKNSMIVFYVIPFYIVTLYFTKSSLESIVNTNIWFATFITSCYLIAFWRSSRGQIAPHTTGASRKS